MKNQPEPLRLEDFETLASRLIIQKLRSGEASELRESGIIRVGRGLRERNVWEQIVEGDLLLVIALDTDKLLLACKVISKGIENSPGNDQIRPLLIYVQVIGSATHFKLRPETFFFTDYLVGASRLIFKELWECCFPISTGAVPPQAPIFLERRGYSVRLACSHADYAFISSVAALHPFGERRALLTLVAWARGERVGAILAELGADDPAPDHRLQSRLFKSALARIKQHAVRVVRIYTKDAGNFQSGLQQVLMQAVLQLAPALVEGPVSIVEGVSYDFNPAALAVGANVEVPTDPEGTFYYWVPQDLHVFLPNTAIPTSNKEHVWASAKALLRHRRGMRYWLASGSQASIDLAVLKGGWALHKTRVNIGRWRLIQEGDTVFVTSSKYQISFVGTVSRTQLDPNIPGLRKYPLVIYFKPESISRVDFSISTYFSQRWLDTLDPGGIKQVSSEVGTLILKHLTPGQQDDAMWVTPNPFLLHITDFETVPGQVFVVQAWSLRESVLPVLRGILQAHGYSVVYSGDRDGPVIFEDIWLLLNQSEAVIIDFTDKRPNVYLEYGMALVLGKPLVVITQSREDVPSDTPQLKYILYDERQAYGVFEAQLHRAVETAIADMQTVRNQAGKYQKGIRV